MSFQRTRLIGCEWAQLPPLSSTENRHARKVRCISQKPGRAGQLQLWGDAGQNSILQSLTFFYNPPKLQQDSSVQRHRHESGMWGGVGLRTGALPQTVGWWLPPSHPDDEDLDSGMPGTLVVLKPTLGTCQFCEFQAPAKIFWNSISPSVRRESSS